MLESAEKHTLLDTMLKGISSEIKKIQAEIVKLNSMKATDKLQMVGSAYKNELEYLRNIEKQINLRYSKTVKPKAMSDKDKELQTAIYKFKNNYELYDLVQKIHKSYEGGKKEEAKSQMRVVLSTLSELSSLKIIPEHFSYEVLSLKLDEDKA